MNHGADGRRQVINAESCFLWIHNPFQNGMMIVSAEARVFSSQQALRRPWAKNDKEIAVDACEAFKRMG